MFAKCPAECPGTADEAANAAELLMTGKVTQEERQRAEEAVKTWLKSNSFNDE